MGTNITAFNCYGFQVCDKDKEDCERFLEDNYKKSKKSQKSMPFVFQFGWDYDVINYAIACNAQFTQDNPEDSISVNLDIDQEKAKEELKRFCDTYGFEYKEPSWLLCVEYCV